MMVMYVGMNDMKAGIRCVCGHRLPASVAYRVTCSKCKQVYVVAAPEVKL